MKEASLVRMSRSLHFVLFVFFACFSEEAFTKKHPKDHHLAKGDDGRIVGGYSAKIEDMPYQTYLILKKGDQYYACGGSILNSYYILTAAHCLTGVSKVYIRVGSANSDSGGTMYLSNVTQSHPLYRPTGNDYDVGLVRTTTAISTNGRTTKRSTLAKSNDVVADGTNLLVSGWGATSEGGSSTNQLMAVQVPTVSMSECQKSYGRNSITARMICAGLPQGGKDSCQGDSGGPAVATQNGVPVQVGIVSFGVGCARPNYPGVYTKVSAVRSWIDANSKV